MMGWVAGSATLLGLATGCMFDAGRRHHEQTSLVNYLYPGDSARAMTPTIPTLTLPLKVGLAWVPGASNKESSYGDSTLPEEFLQSTLAEVRRQFTNLTFVSEVVTIPTAYLQPGGGFQNLDQIRAMHGVDVIALVSRDQRQFNDSDRLSFFYMTIVGAFAVPAEKNETYTMVDTAVFDIQSRSLLFRAPGMHRSKHRSTLAGVDWDLRQDRAEGVKLATESMVKNLKTEMAAFQERIKTQPETVRIVKRPGYTGAGAGGWMDLAWIGMVLVVGWVVSVTRRTPSENLRVAPVRRSPRA